MQLDELLPILRCPICGTGLERGDNGLRCANAHEFEVVDGVPVLFDQHERARIECDYGSATQMRSEYRDGVAARLKRGVKRAIGSNLRLPIDPIVGTTSSALESELSLEIGSGLGASSARRVHLDIGMFDGVNVVGSGCQLPFADETFSLVRNLAVLEHVREPQRMLAEMQRVVKPGGYVYTEVPFLQHFHAYPNDFQRYTSQGLRQAFSGFEVVAEGIAVGPSSAITSLIGDWCELWTFSEKRWINDLVRSVPLVLLWPLKFLDKILVKNPRAHEVCSGVYLFCRKPNVSVSTTHEQTPVGVGAGTLEV